ncbi:metal ABC transporter solute-binding protein, Zn/Mn family [Rossellomorea marisflavi]|uniref:metal ABC transporter solute-binding protein, Zn/Mn family n=2 Tax=Rossellomorea marisflavi TaxID=189381 RepID=UPI00345CA43D
MIKKMVGLICLIVLVISTAACGNTNSTKSQSSKEGKDALTFYTTLYPLTFFAEEIGGDHVEVNSILPPGANAHNYEPTTDQMVKIAQSDAFIYVGAGMEHYAEKISEAVKSEDVKIVEASNGIDLINSDHDHNHEHEGGEAHDHDHEGEEAHDHDHEGEEAHDHDHEGEEAHEHKHEGEEAHEHDHEGEEAHDHNHDGHSHGEKDPHVWLDPIRSIKLAENIKDTLVELSPDHKDEFNQNFEKLKGELEELDQEFATTLKEMPEKKIIVTHAAYGYWANSYGIKQVAVSGLSPDNEPSQKELKKIIETSEKYHLKYVFFEQNVTPKVAEVVRKEIGAEALRIHNVSVLTDEDIKNGEDYFSLMEKNLETLVKALSS